MGWPRPGHDRQARFVLERAVSSVLVAPRGPVTQELAVRIMFESSRMPVTATIPSDADSPFAGTTTDGVVWFCLRTFDEGEAIPKQHDHARPVSRVLAL